MSGDRLQRATKSHYDEHPFDFLSAADEADLDSVQPKPFLTFFDSFFRPGHRVAEIGCGPGRGTLFMARRGADVLAVDISAGSISIARRRAPECNFVLASNLDLPLDSESFDLVVSDGVIHHTPDAHRSFVENARILRSGGYMYVGVYRRWRYYYYLYTYLGGPVRSLSETTFGERVVNATLLPVYYLAHLVKSRGRRSWRVAKNLFYDYIITPRATFHTKEEIVRWGTVAGLELVDYHENVGNVHAFVFRKGVV